MNIIIITLSIWTVVQSFITLYIWSELRSAQLKVTVLESEMHIQTEDVNRLFSNANETNIAVNELSAYLSEQRFAKEIQPWSGEVGKA